MREPDDSVETVIADNGTGFDPQGYFGGFGLLGMRERVTLAEGTLTIESRAGEGTTVRAVLPARRSGESASDAGSLSA